MARLAQKQVRQAKREYIRKEMLGFDIRGEVITWNAAADQPRKHTDLVAALHKADLDENLAREMLPRNAFARASKSLQENRLIDVLREEQDVIVFQFTKKYLDSSEWTFAKETLLELNKITGKVKCPIRDLQTAAQNELDKHMEARTTSDITRIVQKLFDQNADLYPIRDQGGVYFVPKQHLGFVDKVEVFLEALNGEVQRFPVPVGSEKADKAIQKSVSSAMRTMLEELDQAVDGFSATTRDDTMLHAAEKIKGLKFKIEAYSSYLQDQSEKLLDKLKKVNKRLQDKVDEVVEDRKTRPAKVNGNGRAMETILGHPVTAVMRWMGANGWRGPRVIKALEHYGIPVNHNSVRTQVCFGKTGRQEPAQLTASQIKELEKAVPA